jgi:hypothetical protein
MSRFRFSVVEEQLYVEVSEVEIRRGTGSARVRRSLM